MKPLTIIIIVFIAAAFLAVIPFVGTKSVPTPYLDKTPLHSYGKSFDAVKNEFVGQKDPDMTYAPHSVTFHVLPEREGRSVVVWASDSLPPTTGETDKNSEVRFGLLSTVKYNIIVGNNKCNFYIIPTGNYYDLEC
jgi:hypothetical protein